MQDNVKPVKPDTKARKMTKAKADCERVRKIRSQTATKEEQDAFFRHYEKLIYKIAWGMKKQRFGENVEIDDLFSAGYVGLMRAVHKYAAKKSAFSTVAFVYIRDEMKKEYDSHPEASLDREEADGEVSLLDITPGNADVMMEAQRGELSDTIQRALSVLPPDLQMTIELRYFGDKTLEAAGDICGITKEGMRLREKKALKLLKELLMFEKPELKEEVFNA